jgi:hypothetical protein
MSARRSSSKDMLADGTQLIVDMVDRSVSLVRERAGTLTVPSLPRSSCGCDIPPPCWYPKAAGEVTSHVCPGGTAVLRIRITNCGPSPRTVQVASDKALKVEPAALQLGPMERDVVTVSLDVPSDQAAGVEHEHLVWVHGCHDHFVRWTVGVAKRGADSCHELDVEDCPDYLHHWYDHFYCAHPCARTRVLDPKAEPRG